MSVLPFNATKAASFINGSEVFAGEAAATISDTSGSSNIYRHSDDISIEIATVHGVKGETHAATLYLETYYYAYDLKRIFPYLCGKSPTPKKLVHATMKVAYVGMTRPTHLLCMAIHKDNVAEKEKQLTDAGWECIHL